MKTNISLTCTVFALLLSGCSSVSVMPPVDIPVSSPPQQSDSGNWRPYRSGPMQSSSTGVNSRSGAWAARPTATVTRKPLPDISNNSLEAGQQVEPSVSRTRRGNNEWSTYRGKQGHARAQRSDAAFGDGVDSPWAKEYVPDSHHTEFGIFARRAAADGQARMVMPTGEVYSASVVRRNGPCVSLEIGVTADGDLPLIARGSVEVCR
jgi:hypothetical protein